MQLSSKFYAAKALLAKQIALSQTREDPSHAENTMHWIKRLKPDADEILLLAGFGHDVERSLADRYRFDMFPSYDEYKMRHAARSGEIAAQIALQAGFTQMEANRLAYIIAHGEFPSEDEEVQILCDADSISFFDNNLAYYREDKGDEWTRKKTHFAFDRASDRAKDYMREILRKKPELNLINL